MVTPRLVLILFVSFFTVARAGWKDDVGYTRLQQTFATDVPTAVIAGVAEIEAGDANSNYYLPNAADAAFSGKTIVNKSPGFGSSGHATAVGRYFFGNTNSLIPATTVIDAYHAGNWQGAGFLNAGSSSMPQVESRRVQNHSWIGTYPREGTSLDSINNSVTHINQRLDFAIGRDGFVGVVGVNNNFSKTLPDLLCQSYHTLSVGRADGAHSAGLTAFDVAGRMKPDIVSFETVTSYSTPQVASAAGLIYQKLNTSYSSELSTEDYPRLTKALLLAGAAKEPLSTWSRADSAKPYDARYGAGALNILLAYRTLLAGRQTASASVPVANTGWTVASVRNNTTAGGRTYYFEVPPGSPVPFSAALTWHRSVTIFSNGSTTASMANLDLKLFTATGTTLGSEIDSSTSTVDNVEHIYRATLAPGSYALQVSNGGTTLTPYALAWRTSPTVSVAATVPVARELDGSPATFTLTRTGPTTSPLAVPLAWSGTAVSVNHYIAPPAFALIPAGASSTTLQITPVSDTLAQGDRSLTLTVVTDYSHSAGTEAHATITIQDKPYDAWRFDRFTSSELADPLVSGDAADPDGDGLPNLLEYASRTEPKTSDPATTAPIVGTADDRLTLAYTRPTVSPVDVTYTVEWSGDLQTWTTGASVTETISSTDNGDGTTTVITRSVAALSNTLRQFLRLRVTRE